jgi:cobalt-zinc-cadmium efflux system membrane fusion protein
MNSKRIVSFVSESIPTILVLGAMGVIAYVGHANDWSIPSSSNVFGKQAAAVDDWCADHGVPESTCVQCKGIAVNASTLPSQTRAEAGNNDHAGHAHGPTGHDGHSHGEDAKHTPAAETPAPATAADWCAGHGVPESICTRCNADLIPAFKAKGDWCNGHNLPESQCLICNPELKAKFEAMDPRKRPASVPTTSPATTQAAADWCPEHGVPESICTRCNADLIPAFKAKGDWCNGHNLPESQCVLCNPELKEKFEKMAPKSGATQPTAECGGPNDPCATTGTATAAASPVPTPVDWCAGHGVPESICTRCNASLIPEFKAKGDWCAEHDRPESQCVICNPELKAKFEAMAPKADANADRIVQLASGDVARTAGIESRPAEARGVTQVVETNAEVRYDQTRYAQVSPRVGGNVAKVRVQAGERVKRGDVLALVDSAEVGRAKAEFLTAAAMVAAKQAALERVKSSTEQGFRNKSDLIAAEAETREASIRLFNARQALVNLGLRVPDVKPGEVPEEHSVQLLGLPEAIRGELDEHQTTANLIPVVAPLDGVVVSRSVVEGEVADPAKSMFVVADTSRMWVKLDVPLAQLASLKTGQQVSFTAEGLDAPAIGAVTWISTEVDDRTRTVEVRAEVPNTDGRLLANMFGRARVSIATTANAATVPASAVQWDGTRDVVFVKVNEEVYLARPVQTGIRDGDAVEVRAGVKAGDMVVVAGSYSLMSQLNRSKLGAGCADEH